MLCLLYLKVRFLEFFIHIFNSLPTQFRLLNQSFIVLNMLLQLILHTSQLIIQVLNLQLSCLVLLLKFSDCVVESYGSCCDKLPRSFSTSIQLNS